MATGAAQGCCSSLAHITQSGCAPLSQKRWDSNVGKQRSPRAPSAPARHRCDVRPARPWCEGASAAQPASNGGFRVAPETTRGIKAQLKKPLKKASSHGKKHLKLSPAWIWLSVQADVVIWHVDVPCALSQMIPGWVSPGR